MAFLSITGRLLINRVFTKHSVPVLIINCGGNEPDSKKNQSWYDNDVIKMPNERKEIRDQIKGHRNIRKCSPEQIACESWSSWVLIERSVEREMLAKCACDFFQRLKHEGFL